MIIVVVIMIMIILMTTVACNTDNFPGSGDSGQEEASNSPSFESVRTTTASFPVE